MRIISIISLCLLLATCHVPPTLLEQILDDGRLVVVTRNSPTTYYLGPEGPLGPEYDLVEGFAESLGVKVQIYAVDSIREMLDDVASGQAHVAAAGLTATDSRSSQISFGPVYRSVTEMLIYRSGERRPRRIEDLYGRRIAVATGSSHAETLTLLRRQHPDLTWLEHPTADQEELLERVSNGELDFTITDSSAFRVSRYFYPEVRKAFELTEPQPLAWALKDGLDDSLREAVARYFDTGDSSRLIADIDERYFSRPVEFDYVGARTFLSHVDTRLARYKSMFQQAGAEIGMDWRLLAAVGYQESHWNPDAVSPTGVKGIMMLTRNTAESLGIADREDPFESIIGGARYLLRVKNKIPERIPEPDRTWLALAAYNIGFGHLEDARIITQMRDGNPDRWAEVRANLPLLTQKKWYSRVKRGYARGWAPVHYVDNIRSYYEALIWLTSGDFEDPVTADAGGDMSGRNAS
jgi:membrane-bound lytic murein transglycosylase F